MDKLIPLAAIALLAACGNDAVSEQAEFAVAQDIAVIGDERYWDAWDSQRDMQHSITGNKVSASFTQ